jgi:hypothetical protein
MKKLRFGSWILLPLLDKKDVRGQKTYLVGSLVG